MSQFDRTTLDPNAHGGTFLASQINDWGAAVESMHKGASRPAYAVDGMIWHKEVSSTVVEIMFFDGTDDIKIGTINPVANTFTPTGITSQIPVGLGPLPWPSDTPPSQWVISYAQNLSRVTYAGLFSVIGVQYGAGDGSTTFTMPDWRGRVVAFKDNMGGSAAGRLTNTVMSPNGNTLGAVGGTQTHTLSTAETPAHTHTVDRSANLGTTNTNYFRRGDPADAAGSGNTGSTGGGAAHNNTQPTMIHNGIYYAGV
jgi:microcystin-dependent protein